jgi:uroporphyrin-III C-methyltransferase/precorrin-2 dehydrogenase/sirohydrochlorin ferrochelatase
MSTTSAGETQRNNATARPARMQALATLPVFFKLGGKRAIVAGGSEPALWKAELLAAAGAQVEVYADVFADGFLQLAGAPPDGTVTLKQQSWQSANVTGVAIAIGAFSDDREAAAFASALRVAGVPVNVIDRPAFCDFQFGAIVNRSPLVVAISTDGGAPVFGQAIRSLIESLLPESFKRWAVAAKSWRQHGDRLGATPTDKRRFWDRFADLAMREAERIPTDADLEDLIRAGTVQSQNIQPPVTIIVVGESAETLTLGAVRALRSADLIVFDESVPPATLGFARREAHRSRVAAASPTTAIDEIVAAAAAGKRVVRLSTGVLQDGDAAAITDQFATALRIAGLSAVILSVAAPPRS